MKAIINFKRCVVLLVLLLASLNVVCAKDFFRSLNIQKGLAHTDVNAICQDSTGMLWLGTNGGLQNYDGYTLKTFDYYHNTNKVFHSHNRINAMACSSNRLWLGTDSGITCFDLTTHLYIKIEMQTIETIEIIDNDIVGLVLSDNKYLWVMTSEGLSVVIFKNNKLQLLKWKEEREKQASNHFGKLHIHGQHIWSYSKSHLYQLGIENNEIKIINKFPIKELTKESKCIESIAISENNLYIKSENSFLCIPFIESSLNISASTITHSLHKVFADNKINQFVVDKDDGLWCASQAGHIIEVQHLFSTSPIVRKYLSNNNPNPNLSKLKIQSLLIDKYDNLWVATMGWGVFYRPQMLSSFYNISNRQFLEMGFSQNQINSVTKQLNDDLWLLVERSSIIRYIPGSEELVLVSMPDLDTESNFYQTLTMGKDQEHLYIGLSNGIAAYNIKTKKLNWILGGNSQLSDWSYSAVCIKEDRHGRLWVGSWGKGLVCIKNPISNPHIEYYYNTKTTPNILSNFVSDILINKNDILICTNNGLNKITLNHETTEVENIIPYQTQEGVATSMSSNYQVSIDNENDSIYWIGTIGGGLNKVVLHSNNTNDYTATCYTTADGLTSNDCEIVYIDDHKNVWVGGKDITCLNTRDQTILTYSSSNEQAVNYFKVGAGYKDDEGVMYMGGMFGLTYFWPSQIERMSSKVELIFTNLVINNEIVTPLQTYNNTIPLTSILNRTDEIQLSHLQSTFSIYFSALGYQLSEQIKYRYRMLGYQEEWQVLPYTTNWISYSNFPYGQYTLELQVSKDKGYTWELEGKQLDIVVLPPWWLTTIAKVYYALLTTLILLVIFFLYNKKQNLKRENEMQKMLKTQGEEKYQSKMRFFMNASHELKTPLTLISLATEHLSDRQDNRKDLNTIVSNTQKMLLLITEMVNIRKTDIAIDTLNLSYINISEFTRQLFDEISLWAIDKGVSITLAGSEKTINMDADSEQIGKLIINLLSNAIKYTHQGGAIDISLKTGYIDSIIPTYACSYQEGIVSPNQPSCILLVRDTGIGITPESINYIFERFFQVRHEGDKHLGSGIGLAIAKSVVLQHNGAIIVSSQKGIGTEFIVVLPIQQTLAQSVDTTKSFNAKTFINTQYSEYQPAAKVVESSLDAGISSGLASTLLIVEDNIELQYMLKEHFKSQYNIQLAGNGKSGLNYCLQHYPDIIISDVMMPEMDGIEMCYELKNNLSTANIPIILLTAKANVEHQIEGYESGADLYIPKPFSMKLLEVNVSRLLRQRELQIETFTPINTSKGKKELINEKNELFREQFEELIEKHISDYNLTVEFLANSMNLSRTKLYSLIKESFDESLADYIRNLRLGKAAHLLQYSMLNITEIMFEVGFTNSSHFSRIFKQKFGVSPSEFSKRDI